VPPSGAVSAGRAHLTPALGYAKAYPSHDWPAAHPENVRDDRPTRLGWIALRGDRAQLGVGLGTEQPPYRSGSGEVARPLTMLVATLL
jgi:hypothetical protein